MTEYNIGLKIRNAPTEELNKLTDGIDKPLSGLDIGHREAFDILAEIEQLIALELKRREKIEKEVASTIENDTRPRSAKDLTPEIIKGEIAKHGVHLVADWDDGGSDALDLNIFTWEQLITEFPDVKPEDAKAFFEATTDFLVIRRWKDEHGRMVTDTIYHPILICDDHVEYYED